MCLTIDQSRGKQNFNGEIAYKVLCLRPNGTVRTIYQDTRVRGAGMRASGELRRYDEFVKPHIYGGAIHCFETLSRAMILVSSARNSFIVKVALYGEGYYGMRDDVCARRIKILGKVGPRHKGVKYPWEKK